MTACTTKNCRACALAAQVKKMTSWLVIAGGLIVGLLLVDVAQLFSGRGLSARALGEAHVVTYDDHTWVKFDEPHVRGYLFSNGPCEETCLTFAERTRVIKELVPTLSVEIIDTSTPEGLAFYTGVVPPTHVRSFSEVYECSCLEPLLYVWR